MPKFKVQLSGENIHVEFIERKWLFKKKIYSKKVGFYTTRFVETESSEAAIELVFNMVRKELKDDGRLTNETVIELEEIEEDEEAFDKYAPGKGYTFFDQN